MSMKADFPEEFDFVQPPVHKTLEIHLQEQREKFASQIENLGDWGFHDGEEKVRFVPLSQVLDIIRGTNANL